MPISKLIEENFNCKSGRDEELGHEFWVHTMDFPILRRCDGWHKSTGVSDEIAAAETIKLPIEYLEPIMAWNNKIIAVVTV